MDCRYLCMKIESVFESHEETNRVTLRFINMQMNEIYVVRDKKKTSNEKYLEHNVPT